MRTRIDIDDRLMAEAMAASGLATKRATVEAALRLLALQKQRTHTHYLLGAIEWEDDLKADRAHALGRTHP
jgi:Arc/MetJ family transcription regulator